MQAFSERLVINLGPGFSTVVLLLVLGFFITLLNFFSLYLSHPISLSIYLSIYLPKTLVSVSVLFNIFFRKLSKWFQGLEELCHLEEFTMKQDCSPAVLEVVSRRCSSSLTKLDVESSKHVDDSCRNYILKCKNLKELGVFKTGKEILLWYVKHNLLGMGHPMFKNPLAIKPANGNIPSTVVL